MTYKVTQNYSSEEALSWTDKDKWRMAMQNEINSLKSNQTWDLVDLPAERKPIKTKWVFKLKKDLNGGIIRYKARLVAKGYSQRHHVDYEETYAPVVRYASIRFLIALAVEYELQIDQMDAITAFLQGDIEEEIFIEQPEFFHDGSNKVCRLNRAMYGLKQAGRQWDLKLETALKSFGLTKSVMDPCIYFDNKLNLIVVIYMLMIY